MAKEKIETTEIERKINELKIEMLKQVQKRRSIKKEIARLLTRENQNKATKSEEKSGGKK